MGPPMGAQILQLINLCDERIVLFLNQFAAKSAVFDGIIYDLADTSFLQGGLFMAYFWWAWLRTDEPVTRRRHDIVISLAGAIVAAVISRLMQVTMPFHVRPLHAASLHFVLPIGVNPETLNYWNSLPSDHAAIYFALATAVWYQNRTLGTAAMAWTMVFGLIPRIYLGYHYPSDILAGTIVGIVLMVLIWHFAPRTRMVDRMLAWEQSHRAVFYPIAFLLTYEVAILFFDVRHLAKDGFDLVKVAFNIHSFIEPALAQ